MAYEKQIWADLREGGTPISALHLNYMESGIESANIDRVSNTAGRPDPAEVGIGAAWYDTDLSLPIWSDGITWRDAFGNDLNGPS